jgi:hypothetical protein
VADGLDDKSMSASCIHLCSVFSGSAQSRNQLFKIYDQHADAPRPPSTRPPTPRNQNANTTITEVNLDQHAAPPPPPPQEKQAASAATADATDAMDVATDATVEVDLEGGGDGSKFKVSLGMEHVWRECIREVRVLVAAPSSSSSVPPPPLLLFMPKRGLKQAEFFTRILREHGLPVVGAWTTRKDYHVFIEMKKNEAAHTATATTAASSSTTSSSTSTSSTSSSSSSPANGQQQQETNNIRLRVVAEPRDHFVITELRQFLLDRTVQHTRMITNGDDDYDASDSQQLSSPSPMPLSALFEVVEFPALARHSCAERLKRWTLHLQLSLGRQMQIQEEEVDALKHSHALTKADSEVAMEMAEMANDDASDIGNGALDAPQYSKMRNDDDALGFRMQIFELADVVTKIKFLSHEFFAHPAFAGRPSCLCFYTCW